MTAAGKRWVCAAVELAYGPNREVVIQRGLQRHSPDPTLENTLSGGVPVRFMRTMVVYVTNPAAKRARVTFTVRTEDSDDRFAFAADVEVGVNGPLQVDAFRTRQIAVRVVPRPGVPGPSGPLQSARTVVWVELDADRDIVPGGEVRVDRALSAELNDALPQTFDSQAIQWYELKPSAPLKDLDPPATPDPGGGQNAPLGPRAGGRG